MADKLTTYKVDTLDAATRRPTWHGMLCAKTCDETGQRTAEVPRGRYFTIVTCNWWNSITFCGRLLVSTNLVR